LRNLTITAEHILLHFLLTSLVAAAQTFHSGGRRVKRERIYMDIGCKLLIIFYIKNQIPFCSLVVSNSLNISCSSCGDSYMHTLYLETFSVGRSQWPFGLRRGSTIAQLLVSRVRILLRSWMLISCVRFVGSGFCHNMITSSEEF
jgi:hypothetical protein